MSVENAIREKHAFRERLKEFLSIAAAMSNDELEMGLGRLADLLSESEDEADKLNIETKGAVLNWYFHLRKTGVVAQNEKDRKAANTLNERREIASARHRKAMNKWMGEGHLEKWKQQPFWKRFLLLKPSKPSLWACFYGMDERDERQALEDHFLSQVASFALVPKGAPQPEVTPEDVKLLAT